MAAPSDFTLGRHSVALHGFSRLEPHICTGSGASSGRGKKQRYCPLSVISSRPTNTFTLEDCPISNSSSQPSWVLVSVKATPSRPCCAARSRTALGLSSQPLERCECACRSMSMRPAHLAGQPRSGQRVALELPLPRLVPLLVAADEI